MGTRACIARPLGASWQGYYLHWDGAPDHLGRVIVEMAAILGTEVVFEHAATAPPGWSHFPNEPADRREPFVLSPEEDGGIEWLYVLERDGTIAVHRGRGWGDPDLHGFGRVGVVDPLHPDAVAEMVALGSVRPGINAAVADFDDAKVTAFAPAPPQLLSWKERIGRSLRDTGQTRALEPSRSLRTVTMPPNGLTMTPSDLVAVIEAQIVDNDVDLIARPSPELVEFWKQDAHDRAPRVLTCPGWTAWGPRCLVCHRGVPEGQATAYPVILGSRACTEICASTVDDLLRLYDRSRRGRWRPVSDVHTKANGARCYACLKSSGGQA